ncbi:molybdopterin synthase sulfur carrier subunit [Rheinheimera pacifica]|uniref:MoaD/ThiS family protein n=1 Tax=Rheinheimera pacifica TaxID=173990 RepID=UPI0021670FC6|nr:MoaD/ThiS family protein [Rheinheimera pacifica]MCS4309186.1 molybdopterin synthase sulfur carrier subunit [Rheinheimera pacifica]
MIKILFFAALRERLNCDYYQLACNSPTTVSDILVQLKQHSDKWQQELSRSDLLCAVNQTMVAQNASVAVGDEVAFFPPVTGG